MTAPSLWNLGGYSFDQRRHARAIIEADYPDAAADLADALDSLTITSAQVIGGGGGKSAITQALEARLNDHGWHKKVFSIRQTIDGEDIESNTHEIDHFKGFQDDRPGIALEIEWNNKDPFFDRDLGAFARLHLLGLISVGVIVTRGLSLRPALARVFVDHYTKAPAAELDEVTARFGATSKARVARASTPEVRAATVADILAKSKYGEATTHWRKLMDRVDRGLGNPCPLLMVGIESARLIE